MNEPTLKQCPFCGSTNIKRIVDIGNFVECAHCGATARTPELWNTRKPVEKMKRKFQSILDFWSNTKKGCHTLYSDGQFDAWDAALEMLEEL